MANIEKKLLLFLSDPQFSNDEINKIEKVLGSNDFYNKVKKIRSIISKKNEEKLMKKSNNDISDYYAKIVNETEQLLRIEANLDVKKSISFLERYLHTTLSDKRRSFKDQILLLVEKEGGSEVINAAHKIRNEIIHSGDNNAWPLRDDK